jgi:hypothetical protein
MKLDGLANPANVLCRAVRCRRLDLVRTGNGYGTVPRGTTHWTGWLVI